jgi:hypothetical protein
MSLPRQGRSAGQELWPRKEAVSQWYSLLFVDPDEVTLSHYLAGQAARRNHICLSKKHAYRGIRVNHLKSLEKLTGNLDSRSSLCVVLRRKERLAALNQALGVSSQ